MYWHETVNQKKTLIPALALNAEKPRQRKVRSAVCIQSPQARTHNIWTFGRERERMKQMREIRASTCEWGPPW
jgi:hypothetical protein